MKKQTKKKPADGDTVFKVSFNEKNTLIVISHNFWLCSETELPEIMEISPLWCYNRHSDASLLSQNPIGSN